jgi:hypothetical protein
MFQQFVYTRAFFPADDEKDGDDAIGNFKAKLEMIKLCMVL